MSLMEYFISMAFVFRSKSKNYEKSNTELELFELLLLKPSIYTYDQLRVRFGMCSYIYGNEIKIL